MTATIMAAQQNSFKLTVCPEFLRHCSGQKLCKAASNVLKIITMDDFEGIVAGVSKLHAYGVDDTSYSCSPHI